jgi:Glycosyl transferase family 2
MCDDRNPNVLFVTMCKDEEFFIDRWIRHHKCEVKNAQFLVLDDGSSDRTCAIARAHDRVALVSLPTFVQFDDEHRGKIVSPDVV